MCHSTLTMKSTAVLATFLLILCIFNFVSSEIKVDIPKLGKVFGTIESTLWTGQTYMSFLGIPYAESPSGANRFQPPVAKRPWKHFFNATKFGKRCPEKATVRKMLPEELEEDLEDCLNLCVYTKDLKKSETVMFYIYGGGFTNGSSSDHPPKHLLEKDIVLVVPNFRVGALGWLSDLSKKLPGNLPLKDILLALEWVKKHIRNFGGDPAKITVFGQSAGAAQTGALVLSPKTPKDTFQNVIMQSGSIFAEWALEIHPEKQVPRICEALNCTSCDGEAMYNCFGNATVPELLNATEKEYFAPTVGDFYGVLPKHPLKLLKNYRQIFPIMTGFTKDDGSFVLAGYYDELKKDGKIPSMTVREFADGLMAYSANMQNTRLSRNLLTLTLFETLRLDSKEHKRHIPAYFDLTSIIFMKSPIIVQSNKFSQNKKKNITYLYSFDYTGENTRFGYEYGNEHYPFNGGVHHSNDNIYLFSTHELNAADTEIAKNVVSIWTSFAKTGVPRTESGMELQPMETPDGPYFHINTNITIGDNVLEELTSAIDDPESNELIRPDIEF